MLAFAACAAGGRAEAGKPTKRTAPRPAPKPEAPSGPTAWCAPEVEALTESMCHVGRTEPGARRTLVVFLHGAIAENVTWQWTQERALARQAKQSGFEAIFPRAPLGPNGYTWPGGGGAASPEVEADLVKAWVVAKATLEARDGRTFDEVFVMGFSSGAYYTSNLALRGLPLADGFAVFAGGAGHATGEPARRSPVFVGVCADDRQTAAHSRAFGAKLAARGFVHRVDEQRIGHMFGDVHVAHAVHWLRGSRRAEP